MTDAERQAVCHAARAAGVMPVRMHRPLNYRSRTRRWRDAVAELTPLRARYAGWLDALPTSPQDSATADGYYERIEAMMFHERARVGCVFGLAGNWALLGRVRDLVEDVAVGLLEGEAVKVRRHTDVGYATKSWPARQDKTARRVIARVEAGPQGRDCRFIITNLVGSPEHLHEEIYCARGDAANLIKGHKRHLASDRPSRSSPCANQFRLLVHIAANWTMHILRGLSPKRSFWRGA